MTDDGAQPRLSGLSRAQIIDHEEAFVAVAADVAFDNWSSENFLRELPDKWRLSVAAWLDERPVDYAIVSRKSETVAHLHHFMVSPTLRGSGLGERLLAAVEERARRQGCHHLSVKVGADNAGAQRFYARYDFAEVELQGAYLLLQKRIEEDHGGDDQQRH